MKSPGTGAAEPNKLVSLLMLHQCANKKISAHQLGNGITKECYTCATLNVSCGLKELRQAMFAVREPPKSSVVWC